MGELERSGSGRQKGIVWALHDIITAANFTVAITTAVVGYVISSFCAKDFRPGNRNPATAPGVASASFPPINGEVATFAALLLLGVRCPIPSPGRDPRSAPAIDDLVTLILIGGASYVAAAVAHETIGHGLATVASGGRVLLFSSVHILTDRSTRLIDIAGPTNNLIAGACSGRSCGSTAGDDHHAAVSLAGHGAQPLLGHRLHCFTPASWARGTGCR